MALDSFPKNRHGHHPPDRGQAGCRGCQHFCDSSWHLQLGVAQKYPYLSQDRTFVTFATVIIAVGTHNLALGVGAGILLSSLCFAARVAPLLHITSHLSPESDTFSGTSDLRKDCRQGAIFRPKIGELLPKTTSSLMLPRPQKQFGRMVYAVVLQCA